jgi:hypothetical protein
VLVHTVKRGTGVGTPTVPVCPAIKGATSSRRRVVITILSAMVALCVDLEGLGKSLVRSEMLLRWRVLTFRLKREVGDGVTGPGSSKDRQQERISYD